MLMLLSPAKTLDYKTPVTTNSFSIPDYLGKSSELVKVLKQKSFLDLMELMQVSQKIAELNVERFNQWKLPFTTENAKQAVANDYKSLNKKLSIDELSNILSHPKWILKKWKKNFGWAKMISLCDWNKSTNSPRIATRIEI